MARQAARDLVDIGVPSDAVQLDSTQKTAGAGSGAYVEDDRRGSGFSGWWHGMFGTGNEDTERAGYESALASGRTVLHATVPVSLLDNAVEILNRNGAADVDQRVDVERERETVGTTTASGSKTSIPVVEEELQVGKRVVRRGGVRIYSHVVSKPVEQQVRLHEEHVNVERRKADRELSPEELGRLKDETIEMTETAEEPVIAKRARVREEVVIGKEGSDRTETVRDNVRHTEVEIEQLGTETRGRDTATQDYTADYRENFRQVYGTSAQFESMRPAYEFGYRVAGDPQFRGKTWEDAEGKIKSAYKDANPGSDWDQAKKAVMFGWSKYPRR